MLIWCSRNIFCINNVKNSCAAYIFVETMILYFVQEYDTFCHIINVIFDQFKLSLLNKTILKSYWHIWMIVYM